MSNKKTIFAAVFILAVCAGIIAYLLSSNDKNQNTQPANNQVSSEQKSSYKSACDVFTLEIAKQYLGQKARPGDTKASNNSTEGDNVINSTCLYDGGEDSLESRNIQVTTAKNATGEQWNRDEFENSPKETAEFSGEQAPNLINIDNLGEKAFWNPQMGQLNILLGNGKYWIIVQGSIKDQQSQIDKHKEMAIQILENINK